MMELEKPSGGGVGEGRSLDSVWGSKKGSAFRFSCVELCPPGYWETRVAWLKLMVLCQALLEKSLQESITLDGIRER